MDPSLCPKPMPLSGLPPETATALAPPLGPDTLPGAAGPPDRAGTAPVQPRTARSFHLLSIIQAAGWPIWPLIGCSIVAVALVIERFISLRTNQVLPPQLLAEAMAATPHLRPSSDWVARMAQQSVLGSVLAAGLQTVGQHPHSSASELQAVFEGAGRMAAAHLQRYLGALATIASAAPLLGLLGTVIGMIEIFAAQGSADGSGAGGNPQQLAQGISIALYNTAFGLLVAIPTLIFWRYFRARADHFLLGLEVATAQFNRHLNGLRTAAAAKATTATAAAALAQGHQA